MTQAQATVTLTPSMLAEAFWSLGSDEQAAFFAHLAKAIQADQDAGNKSAYSLGELQWFYVGEELLKPERKKARDMLMTMAAPLFLHTLRAAGQ